MPGSSTHALAERIRAELRRAHTHQKRYFCASCRAFVAQRRCRYRHRGRYWRRDELTAIPTKLEQGATLSRAELLFVELFRERFMS